MTKEHWNTVEAETSLADTRGAGLGRLTSSCVFIIDVKAGDLSSLMWVVAEEMFADFHSSKLDAYHSQLGAFRYLFRIIFLGYLFRILSKVLFPRVREFLLFL